MSPNNLEDEMEDEEAIAEIMEVFDMEEEEARELWYKFLQSLGLRKRK